MDCSITASRATSRLRWRRARRRQRLPVARGPLREPASRRVDAWVANTASCGTHSPCFRMDLRGDTFRRVAAPRASAPLRRSLASACTLLRASGNPQRFFDHLARLGLATVNHAFPDHHAYAASDLDFGDCEALLMTEKDAVKCESFAREHWYALQVEAELARHFRFHPGEAKWTQDCLISWCADLQGPLLYRKAEQELVCKADRLAFRVRDGIRSCWKTRRASSIPPKKFSNNACVRQIAALIPTPLGTVSKSRDLSLPGVPGHGWVLRAEVPGRMITLRQLTLARGGKLLLESIDLTLHAGQKDRRGGAERLRQVELFALLLGELHQEAGDLELPGRLTVAHVSQEVPAGGQARDRICHRWRLRLCARSSRSLRTRMNKDDGERLAALYEAFEHAGGYAARSRAASLIARTGFSSPASRSRRWMLSPAAGACA